MLCFTFSWCTQNSTALPHHPNFVLLWEENQWTLFYGINSDLLCIHPLYRTLEKRLQAYRRQVPFFHPLDRFMNVLFYFGLKGRIPLSLSAYIRSFFRLLLRLFLKEGRRWSYIFRSRNFQQDAFDIWSFHKMNCIQRQKRRKDQKYFWSSFSLSLQNSMRSISLSLGKAFKRAERVKKSLLFCHL